MIRLPPPPERYDVRDQVELRRAMEQLERDLLARLALLEARVKAAGW